MKAEELRVKSADELAKMILDWSKDLMNLRFQKAGAQLNNTSEIRKIRRDLARAKTILSEKSKAEKKAA